MAVTVTAVRLIGDSSKIRNRFFSALVQGALTGVMIVFLTALLQGYPDGRRLPLKFHLLTSLAGAVIFQTLISPLGGKAKETSERQIAGGTKKEQQNSAPGKARTAPKNKPSGRKK